MSRGKKYIESSKLIDKAKLYEPDEALAIVCKTASAKFDETIEIHARLGVDSRHADQQVRGAVVLPNGTGKTVRTLVFAKGDKATEAQEAGADFVGAEDMVAKIQSENWFDYEVIIATPDMMGVIGRLGKVLGPKGLMPNPKAGTVTMDVAKAVKEAKLVRLNTVLTSRTLSTVLSVRHPLVQKSLLKTSTLSWAQLLRQDLLQQRVSTSRAFLFLQQWAPVLRLAQLR